MRANTHSPTHTQLENWKKKPFFDCFRNVGGTWTQNSNIIAEARKEKKRRQCKKRRKKAEKTGEQLTGVRKGEGGVSGVGMGVPEVGRGELPTHNALVDVNTLLKQISCHLNDNFEKGQSANGHIERGQRYSGAVVQWDIGWYWGQLGDHELASIIHFELTRLRWLNAARCADIKKKYLHKGQVGQQNFSLN